MMRSRTHCSADHGNDEVFEILEIAIVGEIDFIGKHAFHGVQELLEFTFISGIVLHQAVEDGLDGGLVVIGKRAFGI